jgi:hypothetical protein
LTAERGARWLRGALGGLMVLASAGCATQPGRTGQASGPTVPRHQPGETYRFSDGESLRMVATGADADSWQTGSGDTVLLLADILLPPVGRDGARGRETRQFETPAQSMWPLHAGANALFRTRVVRMPLGGASETLTEVWSCAVREPARISLSQLGQFEAYPVACDVQRGTGPGRESETRVSYYAPALRWFARLESTDNSGTTRRADLVDLRSADGTLPEPAMSRRGIAVQTALESLASGRDLAWQDEGSGVTGRIRPVRTFRAQAGAFCREFEEDTQSPGRFDRDHRLACRVGEGTWQEIDWAG